MKKHLGPRTFGKGHGLLLLILLLVIDAILIGMHIRANAVGAPPEWPWWVDVDGGGPEFFQYVKFLWGAVLVLVIWWRWRRAVWLLTALPFVVMLIDDSGTIHEQWGDKVGARLPVPEAWLDYQQFIGEFALLLGVGGILLLAILVGYLFTRDAQTRQWLRPFILLFVLMGVFAGAVDLVHQWTEDPIYEMVTLLEDGGEMVTASALVAWAFHLATQPRFAPGSDGQLTRAEPVAERAPTHRRSPARNAS